MALESGQLGRYLVDQSVLSIEQLVWAEDQAVSDDTSLAAVLLDHRLASEKDLMAAAADQMGLPFVDFVSQPPRSVMAGWLPPAVARRAGAVAVARTAEFVTIALTDPTDKRLIDWLGQQVGITVHPALASSSELKQALDFLYPMDAPATAPSVPPTAHRIDLAELLTAVVASGGSDLHLSAGLAPAVRIDGDITAMPGQPCLDALTIRALVYSVLSPGQTIAFERDRELDLSHTVEGVGRFRINVFLQQGAVGAVMRVVPFDIPQFADLGLPAAVAELAQLPRGLVLVTGPTGSGKTTTLASLINVINERRRGHIMTVEDPVEFVHRHKACIVNQREVGVDTQSFAIALKHVLRQDPDVILVGEMRDLETIGTALTAAETGHLVFGTLHTQSAAQSVDRIIDAFPGQQQQQVRSQLAMALKAVVTQQLVPSARGGRRLVASEVLVATPAISNLVREGKVHQIPSAMQAGGKYGMQTMDQSLAQLVKSGAVTMAVALECCHAPEDLRRMLPGS
jgi:twitching motility protein PilT